MKNKVNEENNVQEVIQEVNNIEEKKVKKNIVKIILLIVLFLGIGIISGFYILKGLNTGVKENTFMYEVLSNTGLLLSNNEVSIDEVPSDVELEYASDSNIINKLTFIQEKDGCNYYYYINEDGDYLYYYSYSKDIYNYYASDSNGDYINSTYRDPIEPFYYDVPDFTKMTVDEVKEHYLNPDETVEILYIPNSDYEENVIYYQSIEAGEKITNGDYGTIIVNKSEQ